MEFRNMFIALLLSLVTSGAMGQQRLELSASQCREMALSASEDMRQRTIDANKAKLDRRISTAAFLPKIDGSATGAYMVPDMDIMGMDLQMRGMYMAGITLTQPIYTGGRLIAGRKLSKIGQEVAAIQQRMTRMDVLLEADKAYWTYIAVAEKVRMLERYIVQMDTLYSQTQRAVDCGMGIENDLLRISSKRSEIRYQWQKAENGRDLCRLALCRLLDIDKNTEIVPVDTTIEVPFSELVRYSPVNRPEIQLLEKQIEASRHQVTMERAEMLPTIGLSAGYTYYGNLKVKGMTDLGDGNYYPFTQEYRDGMGLFMLSVKIPLCSWGERASKVKKAKLDVENAIIELQKNSRLMDLEVEQATRNLSDARMLIATAELSMKQNNENLRIMEERFALSLSPLTDMLDAQSQWQQAESNLIEAKAQYKISEAEYLRALGILE